MDEQATEMTAVSITDPTFGKSLMRQNSEMTDNSNSRSGTDGWNQQSGNNEWNQQPDSNAVDLTYSLKEKDSEIDELKKKVRELDEQVQYYALRVAEEGEPHSNSWPPDSSRNGTSEEFPEMQRKLDEKEEALTIAKQENDRLSRQLSDASRRAPSARSRNALDAKMHIRLNETVGKCKDLEKNLEKAWLEVEQYKQQCVAMSKRVSQLQDDRTAMSEEQMQKFEIDRVKLEEELRTLQDNLDLKSHEFEGEASKCRIYEEDLRAKEVQYQKQKDELQSKMAQQFTQLQKLEESLHVETEKKSEFYSQVQVLLNEKGEEKVQKEQYKMEVSRLTEQKRVLEEETTKVCTGFQDEAKEAWLNYEQLEEKSRSDSKEIKELRNKIRDYTNRLDDYQKEKITLNGMVKELEAKRKELEAKYRQLDEGSKSAIQGLKDENMANQISAETYEEYFKKESTAKNDLGKRLKKEKEANESLCAQMQNLSAKNETLTNANRDLMEQLNAMAATQCLDAFSDAQ